MNRSAYQDNGVELNPLAAEYFPNSNITTITTINGVTQGRSIIYAQESGVNADGAALPPIAPGDIPRGCLPPIAPGDKPKRLDCVAGFVESVGDTLGCRSASIASV